MISLIREHFFLIFKFSLSFFDRQKVCIRIVSSLLFSWPPQLFFFSKTLNGINELPVVIKPKQNGKSGCTLTLSKPFLSLLFSCYAVSNPFTTQWTVACQFPPAEGLSRQGCWSGLPFLQQGIFSTRDQNHLSYVPCIGR